jgi:hypothetical protein
MLMIWWLDVQLFRKSVVQVTSYGTSITLKLASDTGKSASELTYFDSIGVFPEASTSRNTRKKKNTTLMNAKVIWAPK